MLSIACKPDSFESYNSLKISFTNIWGFCSNFVDCNSPDILVLWETNLDCYVDSGNFTVRRYLPLTWRILVLICMVSQFGWKKDFLCTRVISRKPCTYLLMFSTGFILSVSYFLFPVSTTFFVFVRGFWLNFIPHRWGFLGQKICACLWRV